MIVEGKFIKRIFDTKEKKRKFIWDEKWNKITNIHNTNQEEFKKFIEHTFFKDNQFRYIEIDEIYTKVYNKYKYEEGIWKLFDKFKEEEEERRRKNKEEKTELNNALQDLYDRIISYFNKNPYKDKLYSEKSNIGTKIIYEFETGEKVIFIDKSDKSMNVYFTYKRKNYQINISGLLSFRIKFIHLINEMNTKTINRQYKKSKIDNKSTTVPKTPPAYDENKKRRYYLLKDTLKGYESQLKREMEEGKDTTQTKNEINTIKNKIELMNQTHHFEHLHNFINFKKII